MPASEMLWSIDILERLAPENTLNHKNCRRVIKLTHSWPLRQSSLRRMRSFRQRSSPKSEVRRRPRLGEAMQGTAVAEEAAFGAVLRVLKGLGTVRRTVLLLNERPPKRVE